VVELIHYLHLKDVLAIHVEIDSKQTEKVEFRNFLWFSYLKKVIISYHLFSFCGSIQDYKIHMDMEIVKFT